MTTPTPLSSLHHAPGAVITVGAAQFDQALASQAVDTVPVAWQPYGASRDAVHALSWSERTATANRLAVDRMLAVEPTVVDVVPAGEALDLGEHQLLHAGPPITWEQMSGPMRGAVIGAAVYEGWAADPGAAERLAGSGRISFEPCHHHGAVGPMAGITSPSMPVCVLDDGAGRRAHCTLNEGLGRVLRYGAYDASVIERLHWIGDVLGPALRAALARRGGLGYRSLVTSGLVMGDEGHNRNRATTSMVIRALAAELVGHPDGEAVLRFIAANDHFALNLTMAAGKLIADAGRDVAGSSVVVAMARNGTDFGVQLSGTGDRWFVEPSPVPDGLYLAGFGPDDANPDIGDSTITETIGLGGLAMAAAPAIVQLVGGEVGDASRFTDEMYEITVTEHPEWSIPTLGFRGVPFGLDAVLIARTGLVPRVNTGIAGRVAGTGQVGAGLVAPPRAAFERAVQALAATVDPGGIVGGPR